jgi:hypothetical protein
LIVVSTGRLLVPEGIIHPVVAGRLLVPEGIIHPVVTGRLLVPEGIVHPVVAGRLLVPEGIIHPIVSVSALIWFIRYIVYRNSHFLNSVIIIKTKVLFPQAYGGPSWS